MGILNKLRLAGTGPEGSSWRGKDEDAEWQTPEEIHKSVQQGISSHEQGSFTPVWTDAKVKIAVLPAQFWIA